MTPGESQGQAPVRGLLGFLGDFWDLFGNFWVIFGIVWNVLGFFGIFGNVLGFFFLRFFGMFGSFGMSSQVSKSF